MQPLGTRDEILANTTWRLLQLRDFVDASHQLTAWGKVLQEALSAVPESKELQESVFLAIEMLRFGYLNLTSVSPDDMGSPARGTGESCIVIHSIHEISR